jgi:hypothetical protein
MWVNPLPGIHKTCHWDVEVLYVLVTNVDHVHHMMIILGGAGDVWQGAGVDQLRHWGLMSTLPHRVKPPTLPSRVTPKARPLLRTALLRSDLAQELG